MKKLAIITDDNAGFTQEELKTYKDLYCIGMPTIVDGETFYENLNLTHEDFFDFLEQEKDIRTSQPAPGEVLKLWDKLLEEYEYIIHVPMSGGLSKSTETAIMLSRDYDGRVLVVDNRRISTTLKRSIKDAMNLRARGVEPKEIKEFMEETSRDSTIFIMVDTLKYLKKGGRISPAAAALGGALHIKPILEIKDGLLEPMTKVIGTKKGRAFMLAELKKVLLAKYDNDVSNVEINVVYSKDIEKALDFKFQIEQELNIKVAGIEPLSLSVSTHIGPGSLAITTAKIFK